MATSTSIEGLRNYSATVIEVPPLRKAANSDRLYIIDKLGMTAIVDESWHDRVGKLAILFPAEAQLSERYTQRNNLFRSSDKNLDETQSGYLEDNRRVRSLKLRGNISNGLVMPLSSLGIYFPEASDLSDFKEGDVFDTVNGEELCRKYTVPVKESRPTPGKSKVDKAFKRVDSTFLPEHFDTGQYLREEHTIPNDAELIITQKLHGTSVRLANTVVKRQLTKRERFARKFLGAQIKDHDYDLVAGSRRVIKDPNNLNQEHYYSSDIWSDALKLWGDRIPKNHVVYGELVGYLPGSEKPIQDGHTYGQVPGTYELYVYRVAIVTEDADLIDLSWNQVRAFCERHDLRHVPELDRLPKAMFDVLDFDELNFREEWISGEINATPRYNDKPVMLTGGGTGKDEGIAIREESGMVPNFLKYKNKSHYLYESEQLDTGEADMESQG